MDQRPSAPEPVPPLIATQSGPAMSTAAKGQLAPIAAAVLFKLIEILFPRLRLVSSARLESTCQSKSARTDIFTKFRLKSLFHLASIGTFDLGRAEPTGSHAINCQRVAN
jgi:hypothetical protein